MNEAVETVIQLVTRKLSVLPWVTGIVLGGSRARGTNREDADIDIGIYYHAGSFDLDAINLLAAELDDEHRHNLVVPPGAWGEWVNGGGWLIIHGYHVDLILRDLKRVEQVMADTERGLVAAHYQAGHPHGYISAMYRGELAISKILYAQDDGFTRLKTQAERYPAALQKSLISFFLFEAEFSLMFTRANAGENDKYYVAGHIFRVISCLNQVLFACQQEYCINEKKAVRMIDAFVHKPESYGERVNQIFDVLSFSLEQCCELAGELCEEVKQIASKWL